MKSSIFIEVTGLLTSGSSTWRVHLPSPHMRRENKLKITIRIVASDIANELNKKLDPSIPDK
jgi:hypothetical protein